MAEIIDGRKIGEEILSELKQKVRALAARGIRPKLAVIFAGENPGAASYVNTKQKRANEIGIVVEIKKYPEAVDQASLEAVIESLNNDPSVHGIIVQLPLSAHLDKEKILDGVSEDKDVDCLSTANRVKLASGESVPMPPAAAAIMRILDYHKIDLANSHILIVGSGELVGKPLSSIFLNRKINFELANRYTENLRELAKKADVIITGVGKPGLITGEMIKPGAVVIDAGTTGSEEGEIVGDVEFESVQGKARLLAPVPGGVGPVTIAMLFKNVVDNAMRKINNEA